MPGIQDPAGLTDEELVKLARAGDDSAVAAVISRMLPAAKAKARSLAGGSVEPDDLAQEGMFGLISAIHRYDESAGASFKTFAGVCMERKILSAVKAAARQKHMPLANYVNIDSDTEFSSVVSPVMNPEDMVIAREAASRAAALIEQSLSGFERQAIRLYLSGISYEGIARKLGCTPKSVDNALQRVRRKLKSIL